MPTLTSHDGMHPCCIINDQWGYGLCQAKNVGMSFLPMNLLKLFSSTLLVWYMFLLLTHLRFDMFNMDFLSLSQWTLK